MKLQDLEIVQALKAGASAHPKGNVTVQCRDLLTLVRLLEAHEGQKVEAIVAEDAEPA